MSRQDTALRYFNENRDVFDERAARGIELYRKGDAKITLVCADGTPVRAASVHASQVSHEFKFGSNCFMLDELETDEKNAEYKRLFAKAFNLATIPFYWCDNEPVEGQTRYAVGSPKIYRRPATDLCLDFCLKNGITPKAHCLNYDRNAPSWLPDDDTKVKHCLCKRFRELAQRYADDIPYWEVTNETFWSDGHTHFYDDPDFIEWSFDAARRCFPANELIINEAVFIWEGVLPHRSPYYYQIDRALSKGAKIDTIGLQFHSFFRAEREAAEAVNRYNPANLYKVMDAFARFGKPIQITETTLPQYFDSDADRDIQAELLKDTYTAFFSHPSMNAVIYWNLPDGYAYGAKPGDMTSGENYYRGGLLNFDMTPKPAYNMLVDLTQRVWHTEADSDVTESRPYAAFRGFYGDYALKIVADGREYTKSVSLGKASNNNIRVVLD